MLGFLIRASIVALGLWLATAWVNGVYIDTPATLILDGVLLGIVNSIVRPIAILLTLTMTIVTLGLFLLGTMAIHVVSVSQMRYRLAVMSILILGTAVAAAARLEKSRLPTDSMRESSYCGSGSSG